MKNVQLISKNLRQIDHLYTKKLTNEFSSIKVNNHYEVLLILAKQQEPITQNQLAELLHIDKSRMANVLFYLEEKNWLLLKETRQTGDSIMCTCRRMLYYPYLILKQRSNK